MSNYEKQEGDFLLNDNGPKKKSPDDPDGKAKYFYKGQDYQMKLYINNDQRQGKKDPDFKGSVEINGDKAQVVVWKTVEKRSEKSPDLTGKITIGDTKYPIAAWLQNGRYGAFWSGKTSFDRGEPAGNNQQQQNQGGGMSGGYSTPQGGMSSAPTNQGYERVAPTFDLDSEIPF